MLFAIIIMSQIFVILSPLVRILKDY